MPIKTTLIISDLISEEALREMQPQELERLVDKVLHVADKHQEFTLNHHGPIEVVDEHWGQG